MYMPAWFLPSSGQGPRNATNRWIERARTPCRSRSKQKAIQTRSTLKRIIAVSPFGMNQYTMACTHTEFRCVLVPLMYGHTHGLNLARRVRARLMHENYTNRSNLLLMARFESLNLCSHMPNVCGYSIHIKAYVWASTYILNNYNICYIHSALDQTLQKWVKLTCI